MTRTISEIRQDIRLYSDLWIYCSNTEDLEDIKEIDVILEDLHKELKAMTLTNKKKLYVVVTYNDHTSSKLLSFEEGDRLYREQTGSTMGLDSMCVGNVYEISGFNKIKREPEYRHLIVIEV